jgi:hypothetical protein
MISSILDEKMKDDNEKISLIQKIQKRNVKSECFNKSLNSLLELYNK